MTLPRGWAKATLKDTLSELRTGPFGSAVHKHDYVLDGTPLINPMHIVGGRLKPSPEVTVGPSKESELADFRLRKGDVILGRRGEMGRCAVVHPHAAGWLIGTGSMALTPSEAIDSDFLRLFLSSKPIVAELEGNAVGSTMVNLNQSILLNLGIQVPPVAEQRRIVAKLDALTAGLSRARAELDRVPVLAANLRLATLTAARAEASSSPAMSVDDLASTSFDGPFGSNLKSDDYVATGVRVVRLENIGHLTFIANKETFISSEKYKTLTRHTLVPRDILFSSFVDREVRVCLFPDGLEQMAINKADCFALRVDADKCDPRFLCFMLGSPETYEAMRDNVHGATRPRIGLSQLRGYKVPCPTLQIQIEIVAKVEAAFARADRMEAEAGRARVLLDRLEATILAKAFRGELVPQDPADEPASALLDRIRSQRAAAPQTKRGRRVKAAA